MNMQLIVYSAFLLLIRWVFYLSPRQKHVAFYGIKAIFEIGIFILLYDTRISIVLAVSGLLILLNLLCYVIEVKISSTDRNPARLQKLELLVGLVLYAAAFVFVFRSGNVNGFSQTVADWAVSRRLVSNRRFFSVTIAGFLIISETEHISRFLRIRFAKDADKAVFRNGAYQAVGFGERAAVVALILLSQFTAAGIIIAGRLVSTGWSGERDNHTAFTMLSLTWALAWSLALKFLA